MIKGKGSAFEREFCKKLSLWWSYGDDDSLFWRTSNSGGRASVRGRNKKKTRGHYGDICSTDSDSAPFTQVFTVELKRGYSRSTFADLLDKPKQAAKQMYEQWIEQAATARNMAGTPHWLLVVRRDRREPLLIMEEGKEEKTFANSLVGVPRALIILPKVTLLVVSLSAFFDTIRPFDIRRIAQELS